MAEMLTKKEQGDLLKIARATIASYLTSATIPVVEPASRGLNLESGCFVTIKQQLAMLLRSEERRVGKECCR